MLHTCDMHITTTGNIIISFHETGMWQHQCDSMHAGKVAYMLFAQQITIGTTQHITLTDQLTCRHPHLAVCRGVPRSLLVTRHAVLSCHLVAKERI